MSQISDLILQQVKNAAGNVEIPSNVKNSVLSGLSESIFGGLTQTASKPGGLESIKELLTGKSAAAAPAISNVATNLFTKNILSKLNLGNLLNGTLTGLIPGIVGQLGGILKDQDGDGDADLQDILIAIKGGEAKKSGAGILGAATGILGSILGKK